MKKRLPGIAVIALLLAFFVPVVYTFAGVEKVRICHYTDDDSGTVKVLEVGDPAVDKHIREHGDRVLQPAETLESCTTTPLPTDVPSTVVPLPTDVPSTVVPEPTVPIPLPTDVPGTEVPLPTVPIPPPTETPPQ